MSKHIITRNMLAIEVLKTMKQWPDWRYGQTVYNVAATLMPTRAMPLNGTDVDPYHDDSKVNAFLDKLFN